MILLRGLTTCARWNKSSYTRPSDRPRALQEVSTSLRCCLTKYLPVQKIVRQCERIYESHGMRSYLLHKIQYTIRKLLQNVIRHCSGRLKLSSFDVDGIHAEQPEQSSHHITSRLVEVVVAFNGIEERRNKQRLGVRFSPALACHCMQVRRRLTFAQLVQTDQETIPRPLLDLTSVVSLERLVERQSTSVIDYNNPLTSQEALQLKAACIASSSLRMSKCRWLSR